MTGLIAIDESGDTGKEGSRFFIMAAIVTSRSRNFLKAYKATPTSDGPEIKFYDANIEERIRVLREVSKANASIVYVCIDKEDPLSPSERGNDLYRIAIEELIRNAMMIAPIRDLRIVVDESRFIRQDHLKQMAKDISIEIGKNVKSCDKVSSDRCVRIADYVAGAIRTKFENGNEELFEIIREKISTPVNH